MLKITKNQGSIQVTASESGFYPFDGTITFPTNSLFTATSANTDMITFKSTSNGDVQFVGNYKDITISGRSYDTKQKFLTAFSNLANQGSVDAYTKAETDAKLNDKLTAQTNANGALFISSSSNDDANSSVALYNSTVKGSNDVAIGWASTPSKDGMHNLAMLYNAQANGSQNIAIGDQRRCDGYENVGIGCGKRDTADVLGTGNVCIGKESQVHTVDNTAVNNSIAIGSAAWASNDYSTVIGTNAAANCPHAVAVGSRAHADTTANWSVAIGEDARTYGERCVAIGNLSNATNDTPLVINAGHKTVDDNDQPLTVLQSDATGKLSVLKGDGTDERIVIQDALSAGGGANPLVAVKGTNGDATIADSITDGIAIGSNASSTRFKAIAIGNDASAFNSYCIVIGPDARSFSYDVVAVGHNAYIDANSNNSVVVGSNASARGEYSVAIGDSSTATDDKPLEICCGKKVNGFPLSVLQSDANGKISLLKGDGSDERMIIQDEIAALKNAGGSGGGGTVDAYTKAETDNLLNAKQNTLTAGSGITIDENNVISSTGGSGGSANPYVNVKGTDSAIISEDLTNAVAIGSGAKVTEENGVAIGPVTKAFGGKSVAVGYQATSQGEFSVGIGSGAMASGQHGIAVGYQANSVDNVSVAIGWGAIATANKPLVINAGGKTMIQGNSNGKINIPLGDGTASVMCLQDEIAALKAEIAALKGGASTGA